MPFGIDPELLLIVGVVGGMGAAATYTSFHYAEKVGPKLTLGDLLPAPPWVGLPIPMFFYTKPEVVAELRGRR